MLRAHDVHVTFLNLSNVLSGDTTFNDASGYASVLGSLPVVGNVLIITTSTDKEPGSADVCGHGEIVEATGPFLGLHNLAEYGGITRHRQEGCVTKRQYAHPDDREVLASLEWSISSHALFFEM